MQNRRPVASCQILRGARFIASSKTSGCRGRLKDLLTRGTGARDLVIDRSKKWDGRYRLTPHYAAWERPNLTFRLCCRPQRSKLPHIPDATPGKRHREGLHQRSKTTTQSTNCGRRVACSAPAVVSNREGRQLQSCIHRCTTWMDLEFPGRCSFPPAPTSRPASRRSTPFDEATSSNSDSYQFKGNSCNVSPIFSTMTFQAHATNEGNGF